MTQKRRRHRALFGLAATFLASVVSLARADERGGASAFDATASDAGIAARALDTSITWRELDPLLVLRRAMSRDGREALHHLAESKLLERLGRDNGLALDDAALEARLVAFEREMRASGETGGLETFLKKGRLTRDELKRFFGLAHVQEMLTRRALGLPGDAQINGDQQRLWIDEELAKHGYVELPPPWTDGLVARAGDFEIRLPEFVAYLRRRLPVEALREDCYQTLLLRRIEARMPDAARDTVTRYVENEIARRKREAESDPRYKGVPYERLLLAQGVLVDRLGEDPAVRIAALTRLWVDRSHPEDALKKTYADERDKFDARYGAAIDTSMVFLRAAEFTNTLSPRSFVKARAELEQLVAGVASQEAFQALAKEKTEDAASKETSGALGFLTAGEPKLPPQLRSVLEKKIADPLARGLSGPHDLSNGVAMLWLGARRPAPAWSDMQEHVHRELRRRFVDDVLPRASLMTSFEGN